MYLMWLLFILIQIFALSAERHRLDVSTIVSTTPLPLPSDQELLQMFTQLHTQNFKMQNTLDALVKIVNNQICSARYDADFFIKLEKILDDKIVSQNKHLGQLKSEVAAQNKHLEQMQIEVVLQNKHLEQVKSQVISQNNHLEQIKSEVAAQNKHLEQMKIEVVLQNKHLEQVKSEVISQSNHLEQIKSEVAAQNKHLEHMKIEVILQNKHLEQVKSEVISQNKHLYQIKSEVAAQNKHLEQMKIEVLLQNKHLEQVKSDVVSQNKHLDVKSEVAAQNKHLEQVKSEVVSQNQYLQQIKSEVAAQNKQSEEMKSEVKQVGFELGKIYDLLKKMNNIDNIETTQKSIKYPEDCREIQREGTTVSGIYKIKPKLSPEPFEVLCDMDTRGGGWVYVMKRFDSSQDFNLNWTDYKNGFGKLTGEFWLGLNHLYELTNSKNTELLIERETFEETTEYRLYGNFIVGNEEESFKMKSLSYYSGNATGGMMTGNLNNIFYTTDRDSPNKDVFFFQAPWWYSAESSGPVSFLTQEWFGKYNTMLIRPS